MYKPILAQVAHANQDKTTSESISNYIQTEILTDPESARECPPLQVLAYGLQTMLLPTPTWSLTEHIIEILCHVELYRRRTVEVAKLLLQQDEEAARREKAFLREHEKIALQKMAKASNDKQRRESYWTIVLSLARADILQSCKPPNPSYAPAQVLRKYFPVSLASSTKPMHSSLNPAEISFYNSMKAECLNLIKNVVEWEERREARNRRSHTDDQDQNVGQDWETEFEERFGDPFRTRPREDGPASDLGSIVLKFVDKVVNNNDALLKVIEMIKPRIEISPLSSSRQG
ncbi:hypothetical protein SISSUDRAFT_1119201 [Sistotremastrum suecicum HHB10207 ss-3]|uniref:Uncharacterized protein n=1 Tax=Sistotremastrum suecicum HHB10207 ss-3 TaxID=1314776 RepID=A0A166DZ75_9AGAM|nr:hypothetical protein SISSUDRAFT_1119201 [Sistotremastrum suecicum HHB10207 ss-3]